MKKVIENKEKAKSINFYVCCFFVYCVIGWIYEVFLEVVIYKWGFSNRGVLFGPYLPVYGFGALAFIFTVYRLIKEKSTKAKILLIPVAFIGCALIATIIELVTSYLCEAIMGSWPWQTYVDYAINFEGRIALSPSIRFGLGGAVFLYIIQPILNKVFSNVKPKTLKYVATTIVFVMVVDLICTMII